MRSARLFGLACAAGIAAAFLTGRLAAPERWEYSVIADHILAGQGACYDYFDTRYFFYGPVLYPFLLSAVLWVSRQDTMMVVVQALLFASTCLVIHRIGRMLAVPSAALLGAMLAALHPGNLVYIGKLHAQTLDVFFVALAFLGLLSVTLAPGRFGAFRLIGVGVMLGLATLSRGPILFWCAAWAAWWAWRHRVQPGRGIRVIDWLALGGLLTLAPIMIHGYLRYGRLIPLRTDTGMNLWYGNHPGASGTSYTRGPAPVPVVTTMPKALADRIAGKNEVEQHQIFTQAVVDFVRRQPGEALALFAKKLGYFWWVSPSTGLHYPPLWTAAYQGYYVVIAGFAAWGLLTCLRSSDPAARAGAWLMLLLAGSFSVTQALFYIEGRHRWQLEPLLLIFTAVGMTAWWEGLRKRC